MLEMLNDDLLEFTENEFFLDFEVINVVFKALAKFEEKDAF